MTIDERQEDLSWTAAARLSTHDVSVHHARRLRRQCHKALQTGPRAEKSSIFAIDSVFRRLIGPVVGVAWCLTYLVEIIRRVAAIYAVRP
jgi:hypothetical protein